MTKAQQTKQYLLIQESIGTKPTEFWNDYVWTAENLGKQTNPGTSQTKLYFDQVKPNFLVDSIKYFIFYRASHCSFNTLCSNLKALKKFGVFLNDVYTHINAINSINSLNEKIITNYYLYLKRSNYKPAYIKGNLLALKIFLDTGNSQNWFNIHSEYISDWISTAHHEIKRTPKYIPDCVLQQLNQHIEVLPEPVQRMFFMGQECGIRITELVGLRFNCLQQDSQGGWFLKFTRVKIEKEDNIPISNELAGVIKAQQDYIKSVFDKKFKYLFCATERYFKKGELHEFIPAAKVMPSSHFGKYINWMIVRFNICDNSGEIWHFHNHQCRHTVGTKMINNNVPHHIIQRYLGHSSPTMTSVYAHLMDSTLKREINNYHSKVVNIAGETIQSEFPELDNNNDLQWMKKQVLGEILPNGYCALPANLTCSKGNACLQCGDFRTTPEFLNKHKEHRERTHQALDIAKTNNWQRQAQVNKEILNSLDNIIYELEQDNG